MAEQWYRTSDGDTWWVLGDGACLMIQRWLDRFELRHTSKSTPVATYPTLEAAKVAYLIARSAGI